MSNKYLCSNYISEYDRIPDGFRDCGGEAKFTEFGDCIWAKLEVIVIDISAEVYLKNAINFIKQNTNKPDEPEESTKRNKKYDGTPKAQKYVH